MSTTPTTATLNLTAITTANDVSILQCWALQPGFVTSSQMGTIGSRIIQLGNLANASFSEIPPHFEPGLHNAPNVQYVAFLSGYAHVTLPNATGQAFIKGGANAIIIAADIVGMSKFGHNTSYFSDDITGLMQIPTANGKVPDHVVLHEGPCAGDETIPVTRRSMGARGLDELD